MAIQQPDSFNHLEGFGDSQVILVPIHENRIGEEAYEQMLREARHFADTYDKILVGVLEAYCTYSSHPILGNIPVVPTGEAGAGKVPRPLTLYDSREEGWRAVAQGLAELLEPYRPFFKPGIKGSVYFDKEKNAWCFDKGRKDGVSIWHRAVVLQTESSTLELPIEQVLPTKTYFGQLTGFDPEPSQVFRASIAHQAERDINILVEDHADNAALIRELTEDENLQRHGINWTKDIPGLDYVLHFTQTHCYLTRAFEDTNDATFDLYLNPYRPLTKPIELNSGIEVVREMLKQVANWAFLRQLEAPYSEQVNEEALEITVFHSQGKDWEVLTPQDGWVQVPLWAKQQKGGVNYENTIRIQLANRTEMPLYVSAFWLTNYFGSSAELMEDIQFELKPGEQTLLPKREPGNIFVELDSRTLAYNLPYKTLEVKFLASLQPFSTDGFWMGNLPGPPGSLLHEEEGYFMEKARPAIRVRPLSGEWIAPLLKLRLDNSAYNRPQSELLGNLLRRPDAELFLRALYFESFHLAPRYQLKQKMELQEEESSLSETVQSAPQPYAHIPNGLAILEYQLQQLRPQLQGKSEKPVLLALGDSWFNQAEPVDIPHFLMEDFIVLHAPLQDWGQLEEAVRRLEKTIEGIPSITLLLSPTGELLYDNPARFLMEEPVGSTEDIRKILTDQFVTALGELKIVWESGFRLLAGFGSRLQVVVHGYDYFSVEEYGDRFGEFSSEWRRNVIVFMVDALNARLQATIEEMNATNIHYLDLRQTLEPQEWSAAVIPDQAGFRKLAGQASLFISQGFSFEEAPYPGTEYFLWQIAVIEDTAAAYQQLVDAYPEGAHREWAEERLRELELDSYPQVQSQSQSFELEAVQTQESDALQSLRHRANQLISSNQLAGLFQLLDRELRQDAEPRERFAVYQQEYEQLEKQRRRYKRPSKQLDRDMASLADAVGELVEGLAVEDLKPPLTPPKEGDLADVEPLATVVTEKPNTEHRTTEQSKTGSFTDPRDGRTYRTVELNGLVWMAENLNYDVGEGCWFYDNAPKNEKKYGRLYTWKAAQRACPPGWRLSTDEEWKKLRDSFGGEDGAYEMLMEEGGSGFEALLGGYRNLLGRFYYFGGVGLYWSATEISSNHAWSYDFSQKYDKLYRSNRNKSFGYSCRCVQIDEDRHVAWSEADIFEMGSEALQTLRRHANELIAINQLGTLFDLLDRKLRPDVEPRERLISFQKKYIRLESPGRYNKRSSKQWDSLADELGKFVESLEVGDIWGIGDRSLDVRNRGSKRRARNIEHQKTGSFIDPRDGCIYRTVEFNELEWMAENLDYSGSLEESLFFSSSEKNLKQHGRLYTWEAAQRACPPGWRLPTEEEWQVLLDNYSGQEQAYQALIIGGESGFEALHGGYMSSLIGKIMGFGELGLYWSASENTYGGAWGYGFNRNDGKLYRQSYNKSFLLACRCVRFIDNSSG